jgi:hypothetical protein
LRFPTFRPLDICLFVSESHKTPQEGQTCRTQGSGFALSAMSEA